MNFKIIDIENWNRKEKFDLYYNNLNCTYSTTVNVDVTGMYAQSKTKGFSFYGAMIWAISKSVNAHDFMRIEKNKQDQVVIFDKINPSYTVLNKSTEEFYSLWTDYNDEFKDFYAQWQQDNEKYKDSTVMSPKALNGQVCFDVSSLPWIEFTGFDLSLPNSNWLLPIFTTGKLIKDKEKVLLPFNVKVHHAVCDGYHLSLFLDTLQKVLDGEFNII